jgi:hypothetical protein
MASSSLYKSQQKNSRNTSFKHNVIGSLLTLIHFNFLQLMIHDGHKKFQGGCHTNAKRSSEFAWLQTLK